MYGLQLKTKEELIDIILRKDELEKKLREEIKSLKANGCPKGIVEGNSSRKLKKLSKQKIWLITITFMFVVFVTTQLTGLLAVSMLYGVDFPTSLEQYDTVREMIRKNNGMLVLNLCVCLGVFFLEFVALHFILHINPFKNNKSKKQ